MFPLKDSAKSEHFPIVTVCLIALNVLVFLWERSLDYGTLEYVTYQFGFVPGYLTAYPLDPVSWLTILTASFMHGGWMHLIGNMWVLWLFGDNVEDKMGRGRFLLFYLLMAVLAGLFHWLTEVDSIVPVIGASGAVAGVMGAYFLMFHNARIFTYIVPIFFVNIPAWVYLGFWILSQVYSAFMASASGMASTIALWAHIGGFVGGMLLYRYFLRARWRRVAEAEHGPR
ncbi:MAG: rhomboid family intramembrane serine protease [Syntrophomonadaceae bacterium]|nr:rhomboid family intramembrane serine protease [Syntrophomonadaceae bacterium]